MSSGLLRDPASKTKERWTKIFNINLEMLHIMCTLMNMLLPIHTYTHVYIYSVTHTYEKKKILVGNIYMWTHINT